MVDETDVPITLEHLDGRIRHSCRHVPRLFHGRDEQPKPTDALGVIQLEMNDRGQGRGRLAEAVAMHVTDEGVLQTQSARPATIEMEDVVREQ